MVRIWRDVFRTPDVGLDDDFFELGGHSLLAVKLVSLIEQAFQVEVPLSRLLEHPTIASLARVLDGSREARPWTPLVPIRPTGSRKPLFLVHGVGGEVMSFTHLAVRLPADWPVYGIQAAGPGAGEPMPADIAPLAERYAEVITSAEPEGPYYIGGFSSGAVTALAVAQALRERDKDVALLLLIDGGLPSHVAMPRHLRHSPASLLRQMAWWIADDALATPAEDWWPRLASKRRALTARLRASIGWGGSNGHGHGDMRDRLGMWRFPEKYQGLLEARFEAFQRHVPKPYDGDMFLIRSRTGRLFGPRRENLDAAWRGLARGRFDCAYVRASHHSLLGARVDELARVVADCLERAHAATAGSEDRP